MKVVAQPLLTTTNDKNNLSPFFLQRKVFPFYTGVVTKENCPFFSLFTCPLQHFLALLFFQPGMCQYVFSHHWLTYSFVLSTSSEQQQQKVSVSVIKSNTHHYSYRINTVFLRVSIFSVLFDCWWRILLSLFRTHTHRQLCDPVVPLD